jgi:hypothetical protein
MDQGRGSLRLSLPSLSLLFLSSSSSIHLHHSPFFFFLLNSQDKVLRDAVTKLQQDGYGEEELWSHAAGTNPAPRGRDRVWGGAPHTTHGRASLFLCV